MRVVQFVGRDDARRVGIVSDDGRYLQVVREASRLYDLCRDAIRAVKRLEAVLGERISDSKESYDDVVKEKRLLVPFDHPDPYHMLITGTGLSHLGSAAARDSMHTKLQKNESELTDSMKMFKWGLEGGKPAAGKIGASPEWFYKGDGRWVVAPEQALELPVYALDGGEEVEIAGIYLIGDGGEVLRVGFALGNEYSDHVLERQNYLYLAHSKMRQSSFGPEILLGDLPKSVKGHARLLRGDSVLWGEDWLSGEDNMSHSIANLEHHHFKYREFRQPGDVHVHFFGAATGSFTKKIEAQRGDIFEIAAPAFGRPLRNSLGSARDPESLISARAL